MAVAHGCGGSHMKTILILVCLTLLVNSADRQEITRSRDGGFNVLLAIDKQISEDSGVLTKVQVRQLQKSTWIAKDGVNPVLCYTPILSYQFCKVITMSVLKIAKSGNRNIGLSILTTRNNIRFKWYYRV